MGSGALFSAVCISSPSWSCLIWRVFSRLDLRLPPVWYSNTTGRGVCGVDTEYTKEVLK